MTLILCNMAAFAVVVLHWAWRTHQDVLLQRQRRQRERVTLLLWTIATQDEDDKSPFWESSLEVHS